MLYLTKLEDFFMKNSVKYTSTLSLALDILKDNSPSHICNSISASRRKSSKSSKILLLKTKKSMASFLNLLAILQFINEFNDLYVV